MDVQGLIELQKQLASQVLCEDDFGTLNWIAGMDVSNTLYDPNNMVYAACIVLSHDDKQLQETASVAERQELPYIPGLLGFREVPSLVHAYESLQTKPDLVMVDGHGISHPRKLGIASHVGVLLNIPTIGVAKTILVGKPTGGLGKDKGSQVPIEYKGQIVAMLVRTKRNANPLIISSGHRISLKSAVRLVLEMDSGYRLPEPTRHAHLAANERRRRGVVH